MNGVDSNHKLPYYRLSAAQTLEELHSDANGLSGHESAELLKRTGGNKLERTKRTPSWWVFLRQFKDLLVIILLISAGISLFLDDAKTATILLLIALMNAGVGFFQEHKAESLMASLEKLVVPKAKALRDGKIQEIDSSELVPGDVIYI